MRGNERVTSPTETPVYCNVLKTTNIGEWSKFHQDDMDAPRAGRLNPEAHPHTYPQALWIRENPLPHQRLGRSFSVCPERCRKRGCPFAPRVHCLLILAEPFAACRVSSAWRSLCRCPDCSTTSSFHMDPPRSVVASACRSPGARIGIVLDVVETSEHPDDSSSRSRRSSIRILR
jgi:hypothetical protein